MLPVTAGFRQSLLALAFSLRFGSDIHILRQGRVRTVSASLGLLKAKATVSVIIFTVKIFIFHFVSISQCFSVVNNNKDYNI